MNEYEQMDGYMNEEYDKGMISKTDKWNECIHKNGKINKWSNKGCYARMETCTWIR